MNVTCPRCGGSGRIMVQKVCTLCKGSGYVSTEHELLPIVRYFCSRCHIVSYAPAPQPDEDHVCPHCHQELKAEGGEEPE